MIGLPPPRFNLGKLSEAEATYAKGLELAPQDGPLLEGAKNVKDALASAQSGGMPGPILTKFGNFRQVFGKYLPESWQNLGTFRSFSAASGQSRRQRFFLAEVAAATPSPRL